MSKEYKKNKKLIINFILLGLIVLSTCFLAVGYAALNPITLDITGEVTGKAQEGIFIAEVNYSSDSGANVELSNINQCNGTTMGSEIILSSTDSDSFIKYAITVYNRDDDDYFFDDVIYSESFFSNENITFSLNNIELGDIIKAGGEKTFYIIFKYNEEIEDEDLVEISNKLNSVIKFDFEKVPTPVLASNMIPVYYEGGVWKKADSSTRTWYNYQQGKWANAVTYRHDILYNQVQNATELKRFNGTSDYVNLYNKQYNFGKNISVVARFKLDTLSNGEYVVVGNPETAGFALSKDPDNRIWLNIYNSNTKSYTSVQSTFVAQTGVWYTAVGTYDGTTAKLYINGALNNTKTFSTTITPSSAPIMIGANAGSTTATPINGGYFDGTISEVIIFNKTLTESEISQNYGINIKHVFGTNNIVAHCKFDGESGRIYNTTYASEGMDFDGTSDYIDVGLKNYNFDKTITIGARFKVDTHSSSEAIIIGSQEGAGIGLVKNAENKIKFLFYNNSTNTYQGVSTNFVIETGVWYTAVGTYDGTTAKLYINGVLNNLEPIVGSIKVSDAGIMLGVNPGNPGKLDGSFFDGTISDVLIVDETLTESQISENYSTNLRTIISDKTLISYDLRSYESRATGTTIPDKIINTMWVWIPRFYAKTPTSNSEIIDIDFATVDDTAHAAFTLGSQQISGFWVGKFENTAKSVPTKESTLEQVVEIIPNKTSWRYTNLATKYNSIKNMKATNNLYGFGTSVDPHLIKNNEWAAVAYFSNTKYGICADNTYVKVANNGTTYKTGGENYLSNTSQSTTGNVYGVYDMNGGASEYVMGNYGGTIGQSGFSTIPSEQYINTYTTEEAYISNNLQHALVETNGLYNNPSASFVNATNMWQIRDDLFSYLNATGESSDSIGSRTVLVTQ